MDELLHLVQRAGACAGSIAVSNVTSHPLTASVCANFTLFDVLL